MRITPERYLPDIYRTYVGSLRQYLPPQAAECEIAFLHQTRHVQSFAIESGRPTRDEESEEVAACNRGFGDRPLVVLSERWVYSPAPDEQEKQAARREDERQTKLAGLSSRGQKIDLESGHLIPLENPSAVADAIRHVILSARSAQQAALGLP